MIAVSGVTAGCVSLVDNKIDNSATIDKLARQIDCELKAAFPPFDKNSKKPPPHWTVTYTITENVKDSQSAGLNPLTWLTPARVDKFNVGGGAAISNETERNAKAEYNLDLYDTRDIECDSAKGKPRFRFEAWTKQALNTDSSRLSSFGYTMTVTTAGGAELGADFANGRAEATAGLKSGREAVETVDFGFSKYAPPEGDLRVFVTNFPSARTSAGAQGARPVPKGIYQSQTPFGIPLGNLQQNRGIIQQLQIDRINRR